MPLLHPQHVQGRTLTDFMMLKIDNLLSAVRKTAISSLTLCPFSYAPKAPTDESTQSENEP